MAAVVLLLVPAVLSVLVELELDLFLQAMLQQHQETLVRLELLEEQEVVVLELF